MTTQYAGEFKPLEAELWLVGRIRDHISQIFTGDTDATVRKERIRRAIIAGGLQIVILGRHAGKAENYAQAFERLYGEPLEPKTLKGKQNAAIA
jgi:hypothetical protein